MEAVAIGEHGLFVYAIVEKPDGIGWGAGGIGAAAVYSIRCGRLAAVVTRVGWRIPATGKHLREFDEVLHRLRGCCAAVLPAKFGVIVKDERAVSRFLERFGDEIPTFEASALRTGRVVRSAGRRHADTRCR